MKEKIIHIINSSNNSSAVGLDEMEAEPIKEVASMIALPLTNVCNCVLQDGQFPDELKIAQASVIYNGGAKNYFNNYRPISGLGIFSKVSECVICCRLSDYTDKFKLISPYQCGFQKKLAELVLLYVKERLKENIEHKLLTIGIFFDMRKALDSVRRHIILSKTSQIRHMRTRP